MVTKVTNVTEAFDLVNSISIGVISSPRPISVSNIRDR